MRSLLTTALIFLIPALVIAQNGKAAKDPEFAIVFISNPGRDFSIVGFVVWYSDSTSEDLTRKLNPPELKYYSRFKENFNILCQYKFKALNYMYDKGYELLSTSETRYSYGTELYFKHK